MSNETRRIDIKDLPDNVRAEIAADDVQSDVADAGNVQGGVRTNIRTGIRAGKLSGIRAIRDSKGIRAVDTGDSWLLK